MILQLVSSDSAVLRQKAETFNFAKPQTDAIQLAKDLYETMVTYKGLGLAAPQVGLPYRVFALYAVPGIVCFNPRIVDQSEEVIEMEEGCLSFPNLILKIKRPRRIKVRYLEPNANVVTKVFDGMAARCFQHELDHLDGNLFMSRANKFHLERALRKKKVADRKDKKVEKEVI